MGKVQSDTIKTLKSTRWGGVKSSPAWAPESHGITHCTENGKIMDNNISAQLQRDWLDACISAGIPAITTDTSAKVLAVLYVFGGEHEEMTLNVKFTQEVKYIQHRFRLIGGETPDVKFVKTVKHYVEEIKKQNNPPEWAVKLYKDRYGIKIR